MGQWRYSLFTETLSAAMEIAKRVHSMAQQQNDPSLIIGAYQALVSTLSLGRLRGSPISTPSRGLTSGVQEPYTPQSNRVDPPALVCLCHKALCEWHLGEVVSAQTTMAEAISLAKELHDMHGLAEALAFALILGTLKRDAAEVEAMASELIELSTRTILRNG